MTAHKITAQSAPVGRFAVCSCGGWRSGYGDRAYVQGEVQRHLRLVGETAA